MGEQKYVWYCENCGEIDGGNVTYEENCDFCNSSVESITVEELGRRES